MMLRNVFEAPSDSRWLNYNPQLTDINGFDLCSLLFSFQNSLWQTVYENWELHAHTTAKAITLQKRGNFSLQDIPKIIHREQAVNTCSGASLEKRYVLFSKIYSYTI